MSRLEKKCVVVSVALHALLVGILLFGAALMPKDKEAPFTPLHVYDPRLISDLASSGGNPNIQSAPAPTPTPVTAPAQALPTPQPPSPPVQQQQPKPAQQVEIPKPPPEPKKSLFDRLFTPAQPTKPVVETPDVPQQKPKHQIVLGADNLKPVTHRQSQREADDTDNKAAQAREARAARRRAEQFRRTLEAINNGLSSATPDDPTPPGPGGSAFAAANYRDIVASKYTDAWTPPPALADDVTVTASITIARDGSVISARITRSSGNADADRSVQATLDNVTYIAPFPEGTSDQQRTFTIKFNPQVKRLLG